MAAVINKNDTALKSVGAISPAGYAMPDHDGGSNMSGERRGLSALQYWCQKATQGYPGVRVSDMSSSWRDGLAFCALIHHYRPDLIDFGSLRAANILQNNQLAFRVAEEQLGIPALLDAEDMEKYPVPDRLSIATYVSQFYQYFEGGMSRMKSTPGPAPSNYAVVSPPRSASTNNNFSIGPPTKDSVLLRASSCTACRNKVFLLERLIIGSKLYHRSCFRCCRCQAILNPGAYALADDVPDGDDSASGERYECTVCPQDEGPEFTKLMLKTELSITRRRLESFESAGSSSSSSSEDISLDSQRTASVSSRSTMDAIREFAKAPTPLPAHSSSGSEPELRRLSDGQSKDDDEERRPPLPKSPVPSSIGPDLTSSEEQPSSENKASLLTTSVPPTSARYRPGVSQDTTNVKRPSVAPKPVALVTGIRKDPQFQGNKGSSDTIVIEKDEKNTPIGIPTIQGSPRSVERETPAKNCRTPSPTKSLKEAPISTTPDFAKLRENLRKTPTEADPLPERRLSVGSKKSATFTTTPEPIDDCLKKPSFVSKRPPSPPLNLGDSFQRTSSLRLPQKSTSNKISASGSSPRLNDTIRVKGMFESRQLAADDRPKSLSSTMLTSSSLSGSGQLILPDKPRPSPRKFESPLSASSSDRNKDDSSYISPYAGRRSASPYILLNRSYSANGSESADSTEQITARVSSVSPVPMPRRKTATVKVEPTTPEVRPDSSDALSTDRTDSPQTLLSSTEVDKSPGPPKPKRGVVRKHTQQSKAKSSTTPSASQPSDTVTEYPTSLNPFGDDDDDDDGDEEESAPAEPAISPPSHTKLKDDVLPVVQIDATEYPDDLNPFGDEEGDTEHRPPSITSSNDALKGHRESVGSREIGANLTPAQPTGHAYDETLNPFADGSDTSSLRRTPKKKAPAPPRPPTSNTSSTSLTSMGSRSSWVGATSTSASASVSVTPSSPRKGAASEAQTGLTKTPSRASLNTSVASTSLTPKVAPPMMTEARRKKKPAPSVPVPMRRELQAVSLKAIQAEMRDIGKKQLELETRGKAIELRLRQLPVSPPLRGGSERGAATPIPDGTDSTGSGGSKPSNEGRSEESEKSVTQVTPVTAECEEALMIELFELVHEKNALYRRQAELMYIKRYQRLEEEQIELEYQIRLLINKPSSQRTPEDEEREASLIHKLVEVVELRNEVVDAQEMDRRRLGREDEDIKAHRAILMNNSASPKPDAPAPSKKKKKDKKGKKDKKDGRDDPNSAKDGKKTIKKIFKEKYKTLKHGAATFKRTP